MLFDETYVNKIIIVTFTGLDIDMYHEQLSKMYNSGHDVIHFSTDATGDVIIYMYAVVVAVQSLWVRLDTVPFVIDANGVLTECPQHFAVYTSNLNATLFGTDKTIEEVKSICKIMNLPFPLCI